jgi:hypothetical protein
MKMYNDQQAAALFAASLEENFRQHQIVSKLYFQNLYVDTRLLKLRYLSKSSRMFSKQGLLQQEGCTHTHTYKYIHVLTLQQTQH